MNVEDPSKILQCLICRRCGQRWPSRSSDSACACFDICGRLRRRALMNQLLI